MTYKVSDDEFRAAIKELGRFTATQLACELGVPRCFVLKRLPALLDRQFVKDTGDRMKHGGPGRPAPVFAFVPKAARDYKPTGACAPRPKVEPPEVVMRKLSPRFERRPSGPGPSGRRDKITHPETRRLVAEANKVGWRVKRTSDSAHFWLVPPDGSGEEKIRFASSPSDHRAVKNARAEMRRRGIPV